ncbi:hypothetical protein HMI54_004564 [Coelomomyces lativittatus]|nr:hypothetical protein HMI56_001174 [Coelomomyces lativittatus]KAJ1507029.1 hypothetical protein HMI54_004564 [Coelomomyces lativittatus]
MKRGLRQGTEVNAAAAAAAAKKKKTFFHVQKLSRGKVYFVQCRSSTNSSYHQRETTIVLLPTPEGGGGKKKKKKKKKKLGCNRFVIKRTRFYKMLLTLNLSRSRGF